MPAIVRRTVACLLAALGLSVAAGCSGKTSDYNLVYVNAVEAGQLVEARKKIFGLGGVEDGAWIDPRSEADYRSGHIPGAINMPFQTVSTAHGTLDGYDVLVVYGGDYNDPKAKAMSKRLIELGHKDVKTLRGGLREWKNAGFELAEGDG